MVLAALAALAAAAAVVSTVWALRVRHTLQQREGRSRRLFDASPVGLFITGPGGERRYLNPRLLEITGEPADAADAVLTGPLHIFDEDEPAILAQWSQAAAELAPYGSRFRIVRVDGALRWVDVHAQPVVADGELSGWVGTVTDCTDEAVRQGRLQRFSDILEATTDFVVMVDTDGRITYLNTAAKKAMGLAVEADADFFGQDLLSPVSRARLETEALPAVDEHSVWIGEMTLRLPGGVEMPTSLVLVAHRRDDGEVDYYSAFCRDITEQKLAEAQLLHAGLYDALTGLPNRVLFLDRLAQALVRAERTGESLAVISLDLDRFKLVNDSYGHRTGDAVLVRAASRLSEVTRPGDTAARFGGDAFTILCEEVTDEEQALELAERFAATLSAPFDVDGERVFLTASSGVAVSLYGPTTPEMLLRNADAALHRAKEKGRARHELYTEHMRTSAVQRLRTANDLHRALAEAEFRLVYQPEISLADGHITAVEALIRWHHPERGLVPPVEFVPLAEETGLIEVIGGWVLEQAVTQAARWQQARHDRTPLPVWVNISPRQLGNPSLLRQVAAILDRHDVDPSCIGLEITESALLDDVDAAIAQLASLRGLGLKLAVDDFGTGYASLAYLKRLPVDAVKIDRSFVDGLATDDDDAAIVTAVMGMARALRLSTVAEGVETREQMEVLTALGCSLAQGYYFTTPQPASTLDRLLESDRRGALFSFAPQTLPQAPAQRSPERSSRLSG